MNSSIKLSRTVTIELYQKMVEEKDANGMADFIFKRLFERYVQPEKNRKFEID